MKILHTSDWHLGQELYCFDRTEEHLSFLSQIENIVKVEQPDALVVSGDIYHNSTPSNSVMRMFSDALLKIANVNPQMKIIITAGNHDSSSRLEITRNIWQRLNVEVIGGIEKVDGEVHGNGLQSLLVLREKETLYEWVKEFGNPFRHSAILPHPHESQPHRVVGNERHGNACPSACAVQ